MGMPSAGLLEAVAAALTAAELGHAVILTEAGSPLEDLQTGDQLTIKADYVLEATEEGELQDVSWSLAPNPL